MTVAVPQLSVAVGAVQVAVAQVLEVVKLMFVGQPEMTGGVASFRHGSTLPLDTVTVKLHVDLLPFASVAV